MTCKQNEKAFEIPEYIERWIVIYLEKVSSSSFSSSCKLNVHLCGVPLAGQHDDLSFEQFCLNSEGMRGSVFLYKFRSHC